MLEARLRNPIWLLMACLLPLLAGCGSEGASSVSGTVTYQGQPVERGWISFVPADGKGQTAGGPIIDGSYRVVKLHAGKYKVDISEERQTQAEKEMTYEEYQRYQQERSRLGPANRTIKKTTTSTEMPPGAGAGLSAMLNDGENTVDFPLKAKK